MRLLLWIGVLFVCASGASANNSAQTVIHLLSYLGNDYGGAVQNGAVVSESEYKEQNEFSLNVEQFAKDDPTISKDAISMTAIADLLKMIRDKAPAENVTAKTKFISKRIIEISGLATAPVTWPKISRGSELYTQNCANCHGTSGLGDGTLGANLDPKPASFFNEERLPKLSPFQLFNTISLGVTGTGMRPFSELTDADRWALAFYVDSLRFSEKKKASVDGLIQSGDLKLIDVASNDDETLKRIIHGEDSAKDALLAGVRTYENSENFSGFAVGSVIRALDDSFNLFAAGRVKEAKIRSVEAYLQEFEPIERRLHSKGESGLVAEVEQSMQEFRGQIDSKVSVQELSTSLANVKKLLQRVEKIGERNESSLSPTFAFVSSFSIVLREGFEAVLILIALIAVLKSLSASHALKWVHAGWISAILLGIFFWILSGYFFQISGVSKETMEGATSLFAVVMLLGIGFWLHQKSQISRWTAFIEGRVKEAITSEKLFILGLISFMAVFREAFETVLFLRALSLDSSTSGYPVLFGVLSSFIVIFIFSWLTLKFSVRLPIRKLFQFSSIMMAVLAFVLVGKGLKELQEANLLSSSMIPFPIRVDLIGLFPTYETLLAQITIVGIIWLLMKKASAETPPAVG